MSFAEVFGRDDFLVAVELTPPKGADLAEFMESALKLKGRADAIFIPDCPQAIMRINPLAPSRLLIEQNVRAVASINGRDRNRLGFQSQLLSAWALGIKAVLIEEGDNPAYGDHPLTPAFKDLTVTRMLDVIKAFSEGTDMAGEKLQGAPKFTVGLRIKVGAGKEDREKTIADIEAAASARADFVVLGPAYDLEVLAPLAAAAARAGIACLASVMPLKSIGMARYLNDVPGFPKIPDPIIEKLKTAPIKDLAGLSIAADFIGELKSQFAGALIVPMGWERKMPKMMELLGR